MADEVREAEGFPFDKPILLAASQMANSGFDQLFLFFSAIGYQYGVVPVDIALVLVLDLRRRYRETVLVDDATGGSGLPRSEARSVGKECVNTCRFRGSRSHS